MSYSLVDRTSFLQCLLDRRAAASYLEIGIFGGRNFLKIRAATKFAVDPILGISRRKQFSTLLKNRTNLHNRYYQMTSDQFFREHAGELPDTGIDIVFIDGLHTYAQALRDTEQSLTHLKQDGAIVLHDCNPPHAAAATPANSLTEAQALKVAGWDNKWCGDVWKVIVHLRAAREDLTVSVVDCDMGLGVVRKGENGQLLPLNLDELPGLSYADLEKHRASWLDLRPVSFLDEIR